MNPIRVSGIFGTQGFYLMAQFGHSAGNVFQRFSRVHPDIEHIAGRHAFYAQFHTNQGKRADISRNI